jgi:hypothetical protein
MFCYTIDGSLIIHVLVYNRCFSIRGFIGESFQYIGEISYYEWISRYTCFVFSLVIIHLQFY